MTLNLTWVDASVTLPTAADEKEAFGQDDAKGIFVVCNFYDGSSDSKAGFGAYTLAQTFLNYSNVAEVYWASPQDPDNTPLGRGSGSNSLGWIDENIHEPETSDQVALFGTDDSRLFAAEKRSVAIGPDYREYRLHITSAASIKYIAGEADSLQMFWAVPPSTGPLSDPPPASGPVYETDMEIFIIEEVLNGVPTILPQWDFTTEAFAQGYIDTFGAGRDLRIIHFVKVTDETRDDVPAGTPVVWICEKTVNDVHSYMGNPHLTQNYADFWTGIFGGPNATYNTRMLAEYTS